MHANESVDRTTRGDATHSLKFFDDVARLVHEIGRTLCIALDQGHAAVCVVTPATRDLLEKQLGERGIDVEGMRNSGQYVHLDADRGARSHCGGRGESERRALRCVNG